MSMTEEIPMTSPIGRDTPRVDGPLKVSGKAQYTSDFHFPGTAVCCSGRGDDRQWPSCQTRHERGREDARRARDLSSREHWQDLPLGPGTGMEGICEERRPPFEDDVVRYYGQYIALAVADTFETPRPPPTRFA